MAVDFYIACRQRQAGGCLSGAELRQPLQRLRRCQLSADDAALFDQRIGIHANAGIEIVRSVGSKVLFVIGVIEPRPFFLLSGFC